MISAAPPRPAVGSLAIVSAASFVGDSVAPDSIVSAFGQGLAAAVLVPAPGDYPTNLGGMSVQVSDSAGASRLVQIYFVSPGQINFVMPPGTAVGTAQVTVQRDGQTVASGTVKIEAVAPALFTANASGHGPAAAIWIRVAADGAQTFGLTFQCVSAGNCVTTPIDLGGSTDQTFLSFFGTGIRGRTSAPAVTAAIGGQSAEVLAAVAQGQYPAFDQANVRIPRQLIGRGEVNVALTVDGKAANIVTVNIGGTPAPAPAGSAYLPVKTGLAWDYRVTITETVQLPYRPTIEEPAGLLCASVFCGTKTYTAGQINFRVTVNESLGVIGGGESFRVTVDDPGRVFYFARTDPMEMRVRTVSGSSQLELIDTPSGFRLARPLARPTDAELAQKIALIVPAGAYTDVVKTTLTLNGDGVYLKGTYTTDVYVASGVGLIKAVMHDSTGKTLFTQELTAFTQPATGFVISNFRAGPAVNQSDGASLPLTVDFQDPSGAAIASDGSIRVDFNIQNGNVVGFQTVKAQGVTSRQTSGTMRLPLFFSGARFTGSASIATSLKNSQGTTSNTLSGSFDVQ